jgi:hypothetical protein
MLKGPKTQTHRAAQTGALPKYERSQRTVVEPTDEKGKIQDEGGGVLPNDSLSLWGFSPIMILAALFVWEFGLRAACGSCTRYIQCRRKKLP